MTAPVWRPGYSDTWAVCALTESQQADYEERAAILEFEAGNTREDAERLALAMVRDKRTRVPKGQRGEA